MGDERRGQRRALASLRGLRLRGCEAKGVPLRAGLEAASPAAARLAPQAGAERQPRAQARGLIIDAAVDWGWAQKPHSEAFERGRSARGPCQRLALGLELTRLEQARQSSALPRAALGDSTRSGPGAVPGMSDARYAAGQSRCAASGRAPPPLSAPPRALPTACLNCGAEGRRAQACARPKGKDSSAHCMRLWPALKAWLSGRRSS